MIRIVLASHGDFATALLNTSAMLVGEHSDVFAFGLQPGESVDEFLEKIRILTEDVNEAQQLVFLCDLYGGTPFNVCNALSMTSQHIRLIYGINLPVLLEMLVQRDDMDVHQLAEHITGMITEAIGVVQDGSVGS